MCVNGKWIYNQYVKRSVYVSCGKCYACKQEKALRRASRMNFHDYSGCISVFLTLTYANPCIPYIRKSELQMHPLSINVYRDVVTRRVRNLDYNGNMFYGRRFYRNRRPIISSLDITTLDFKSINFDKLPKLENCSDSDKLGVVYYPDFQNFMKKIRSSITYTYGNDEKYKNLQYFACAEYGPNTFRPHFHALVVFPPGISYSWIKAAVNSCWSFDGDRRRRKCELAKNPATYIASYCNSNASNLSVVYSDAFKTRSSWSHAMGCNNIDFTLSSLEKKNAQRDFTIDRSVLKGKSLDSIHIQVPNYVIRRYFPQIKGYSRLTNSQILRVYEVPERMQTEYGYLFRQELEYSSFDFHSWITRIKNLHNIFYSELHMFPSDFARMVLNVNLFYKMHSIRVNHETIEKKRYPQFYAYDNVLECVVNDSPVISNLFDDVDLSKYKEEDFLSKNFVSTITRTQELEELYFKLDKSKKIKALDESYTHYHNY